MSHTEIQMEEAWSIDDVKFNVAGLSIPFFNHDLECGSVSEALDFNQGEERNKMGLLGQGSAASDGSDGAVGWKVQVMDQILVAFESKAITCKGLDPLITASVFSQSEYIGERKINGDDYFILKLCTDLETLELHSKGPVKFIGHVLCSYFSQRTGLLIHLEDSHWTRCQSTTGGDGFDWQFTIMNSLIDDYRKVEGATVAHSGWTAVTVVRFSESAMSHTKIQMEEAWSIDDVKFNVAGLSIPFFNHDLECGSVGEALDFNQGEERNKMGLLGQGSAVSDGSDGVVGWKVQVVDQILVAFESKAITCKGLDPLTTASVFSQSEYIGERKINGDDWFILKLCTDLETLELHSKGPIKFIGHVLCGYFSQRTGLLIHLEDSHWTRCQSTTSGDGFDWQFTIMNSLIDDYRKVEGATVAHSGWTAVTVVRFSESAMSHTKIQMEEAWSIDDVKFNVAGLSVPFFNHDLECGSVGEALDFNQGEERNKMGLLGQGSAASDGSNGAVGWKVQV